MEIGRQFFALPLAIKQKYAVREEDEKKRGYIGIGVEKLAKGSEFVEMREAVNIPRETVSYYSQLLSDVGIPF